MIRPGGSASRKCGWYCNHGSPTALRVGKRFTLRTDHSALLWILNLEDATGKQARWRLRHLEYDNFVKHCLGIKHQEEQTLFKLETDGMYN